MKLQKKRFILTSLVIPLFFGVWYFEISLSLENFCHFFIIVRNQNVKEDMSGSKI